MQASKIILDAGAILWYMIGVWGTLPGLDEFRTNWIRHGLTGVSALVGLVLLMTSLFAGSPVCVWSVIGLVLVGIGSSLTIPLLLLALLFWTHRIPDSKKIESPVKYINRVANLMSGLGLILQLFIQ